MGSVGGQAAAPAGIPLARLLAVAYRELIDGLHARLAEQGWDDVRPSYGFVLLALRERAASVSDLAVLLGVTKQATSRLLDAMADGGYVTRELSKVDARQRTVALKPRGHKLLAAVERNYEDLEAEWAAVVGVRAVEHVRGTLTKVVLAANDGSFPQVRPSG